MGYLLLTVATEEPNNRKESAQNARLCVLPIKYVVGSQTMEQGRADKIKQQHKHKQENRQRSATGGKSVSGVRLEPHYLVSKSERERREREEKKHN